MKGSVTGDSLTKFNMLDDAAASTSGSDAAPVDPDAAAAVREFNDWATSHSEELKHMPEPDAKLALIKEYNREHAQDPEVKYAGEIFYATVLALCLIQSTLVWWKKTHRRSYELVSLLGLWLVPAAISARLGFWRFVCAWALYSLSTGYMIARVAFLEKPLRPSTPRAVFIWFLAAHKLSVAAGIAGYAALVLSMFLAAFGLPGLLSDGAGLTLLWYGLYFGVLGRDAAEVAADRTAATLGAGTKLASSVRQCGLCCGDLVDGLEELVPVAAPPPVSAALPPDAFYRNTFGEKAAEAPLPTAPSPPPSSSQQPILAARGGVGDATVQLACKHLFHGTCVRGWCVVGKKDTCPCCREKVDLRAVFAGRPWETRNLSWLQMLDMLRYLVVWNPLILGVLSLALKMMGVKAHEAERAALREKLAEVAATHQVASAAAEGVAAAGVFGS